MVKQIKIKAFLDKNIFIERKYYKYLNNIKIYK